MKLKMARVQIIGLKSDLQLILRILGRLGCLHVDDIREAPEINIRPIKVTPDVTREQETVRLLLVRIEGLLKEFTSQPSPDTFVEITDVVAEASEGVSAILPRVQALTSRRAQLRADLDSLSRYEVTLQRLIPILPPSAHAPENTTVAIFVSRSHREVSDLLRNQVINLTNGHLDFLARDVDDSTQAAVFVFPTRFAGAVDELLVREDVARLRLPEELGAGPPGTLLSTLQKHLQAIPDELKEIDHELAELGLQWSSRLSAWATALRDDLESHTVRLRFGETENTFVIVGWIPCQDLDRVRQALEAEVGEPIVVSELLLTSELKRRIPIALKNPPLVRPFETLVKLQSLPRYDAIDPSGLTAIFLPLFFGMMLGDIAYGGLLLIIAFALLQRFKRGTLHDILVILAMGSGWGIIFGILYGEFFGTMGEQLGLHPLLFDRASPDYVVSLLLMAGAVGAVHITLGLVLGLWEAFQYRNRSHLLERGGTLLGLVALFLVVGALANALPRGLTTPGVATLIIGIIILSSSFGWLGILMGPVEFIGVLGNIMSYLRIAAIGLASVYLAKVANDMAGIAGNVLIGAIIAVLIHGLNLALGAFSPTIHSLRLHYVEFYRKFYEGGGLPYVPFSSKYGSQVTPERKN